MIVIILNCNGNCFKNGVSGQDDNYTINNMKDVGRKYYAETF